MGTVSTKPSGFMNLSAVEGRLTSMTRSRNSWRIVSCVAIFALAVLAMIACP